MRTGILRVACAAALLAVSAPGAFAQAKEIFDPFGGVRTSDVWAPKDYGSRGLRHPVPPAEVPGGVGGTPSLDDVHSMTDCERIPVFFPELARDPRWQMYRENFCGG